MTDNEDSQDMLGKELAQQLMNTIIEYYRPPEKGGVAMFSAAEVFAALAAVVGFMLATHMVRGSKDHMAVGRIIVGFTMDYCEQAFNCADPDSPNNPNRLFSEIIQPPSPGEKLS